MKAVGYRKCLPIDQAEALIDLDIAAPAAPAGRDLLVEIHAVSVNPVDTKVRRRDDPGEAPRILGFDGAGWCALSGLIARCFVQVMRCFTPA